MKNIFLLVIIYPKRRLTPHPPLNSILRFLICMLLINFTCHLYRLYLILTIRLSHPTNNVVLIKNHGPPLASTSLGTFILWCTTQKLRMFIFGAFTGIPLKIYFKGGHKNISKTRAFSSLRRFSKVNIQMKTTKI